MAEEFKKEVVDDSTQQEVIDTSNDQSQKAVETSDPKAADGIDPNLAKALLALEEAQKIIDLKNEALNKSNNDKENYRKMALKYKNGEEVEDEKSESDITELINKAVEEKLSTIKTEVASKDEALEKFKRATEELKHTIATKSQISSASSGSSKEEKDNNHGFSMEYIGTLKKMFPSWTEKQIQELANERKSNN